MSQLPLNVRTDFPMLTQKRERKPLVYLDSAATALKPWKVIERLGQFYSYETSNVHRGAHHYSDQATVAYEQGRAKVAGFLKAKQAHEIIFTRGTTESVNLVAQAWGEQNVHAGDEILVSRLEHHSNFVPWQQLCLRKKATLKIIPLKANGDLDLEQFEILLGPRTKLVAITQCSNVLGTRTPLEWITAKAREAGALVFVDGAQAVANEPIDLQKIGCDFFAFSGHKLFGPYGIGVLYIKEQTAGLLSTYQTGGSTVQTVLDDRTEFLGLPQKFEAGTPNISGVLGLDAAIDYVQGLGWDRIHQHEHLLLSHAVKSLSEIPGVQQLPAGALRAPILSLQLEGCHPSDVAQILDQQNIAVRSGHLCAQPLLRHFSLPSFLRVSFSIYNETSDIELLVEGLKKAKELLL